MSRGYHNDPYQNRQGNSYGQGGWNPGMANPYQSPTADSIAVGLASESSRTRFLRLTYSHLFGAIALFVALEALLLLAVPAQINHSIVRTMVGSNWSWLFVMMAYAGVSYVATSWANSPSSSRGLQYAGLGLYVVAETIIFLPIMLVASRFYPEAIPAAGLLTGLIFAGITGMMFITGANFSWLGRWLMFASIGAFAIIIGAMVFGFSLGLLFTGFMVAMASGYILYHTSNVMHEYHEEQYVAASLALFASVATLFWYALQLAMSLRGRD